MCVTPSLRLDDRTIYTYRGNYAYYLEKRQERIDNRRAEIQRANNLYRTEPGLDAQYTAGTQP